MVSAMSQAPAPHKAKPEHAESENIKETLQSILIAFILAFVFRSFFVEAFVIPTGSMAPTLLGKHVRYQSVQTGFDFSVNPRDNISGTQEPLPIQRGLRVRDPMSGVEMQSLASRTRSGDRILVLKYIYALFQPERYDVIVFKNPNFPAQNYIKRLIGLAGEDLWLVDGDVFARPGEDKRVLDDGWEIQRKPEHVQREVWQPVYYSQHRPLDADRPGSTWRSPWQALSGDWDLDGGVYRSRAAAPAALVFDPPGGITDYTYYDQTRDEYFRIAGGFYNVSDIRIAAGVKPEQQDLETVIQIEAHGHEFQAVLEAGEAQVRLRRLGADEWEVLDAVPVTPLAADRITNLEFWHVDQSLSLWIDGRRVAYGEYDWHPNDRLRAAIGMTVEEMRQAEAMASRRGETYNLLLDSRYGPKPAQVSWSFAGSPVVLYRVEVDRDLYYRPANYTGEPFGTGPALATHPDNIARLAPDQYFALGDNSALSHDARLWGPPDDWVAERIDPDQGVVNEKMLLGKAFFVYWPSMQPFQDGGRLLVPDFGRMRFIR
jgi:signal peptidase I